MRTAASVPLGVAGLALKDLAETTLRSPYIMGTMLIVVALLMAAAERMARHERSIGQMTLRDCLLVGVAQALALVPGTSRSGITITAGLALRLERATAARFSFLLSTPAVAAAAAKGVLDLRKHGALESEIAMPLAVGIAVSAVTGCAVIALLLRYLRSNSVMPFVVYRVIFGIMIIALAMARS
jgi:undecaprenyl-diphosphatase